MSDPTAQTAPDWPPSAAVPPAAADPAQMPPPLPPAPVPAPPAPTELRGTFSSKKAADVVVLEVDGVDYQCAPSAPADRLMAAVAARESKDNVALYQALRSLVASVMYPQDRARYEARLGQATDEGAPIGVEELIAHGLWLVGAYFGNPTDGSEPSGSGQPTQP